MRYFRFTCVFFHTHTVNYLLNVGETDEGMRTNGKQANPTTILAVVSAQAAVPVPFTLVDGSQQTTAPAVVDTRVTTSVEAYVKVVITFKRGYVFAEELGEAMDTVNQLPASENAIAVGGVAVQLGEWTVFVPAIAIASTTTTKQTKPTAAPTDAPTDAPTAAPTDAPTDKPTATRETLQPLLEQPQHRQFTPRMAQNCASRRHPC